MTKREVGLPLVALALVALVACVTVNVYFPEAAVKDLSKQIEEQVQKEAAAKAAQPAPGETPPQPPATKPEEGPKGGGSAGLLDLLVGATPAFAQGVAAPEVSNPAIRKIIDSRAARIGELNRYKSLAAIGEGNDALVAVRDLNVLPDLKARAEVQRLVAAENRDREELFREIAAAKKVDPSQIPKIRETYAGTLRETARPGDWVQMPDGAWKQK